MGGAVPGIETSDARARRIYHSMLRALAAEIAREVNAEQSQKFASI